MTTTDWLVPGAQVAEYDGSHFDARAVLTTIEKLTATQVVCANGARFHRNKTHWNGGLRPVGSSRRVLLPLTDEQVHDAVARALLSRVRYDVDRICGEQRGGVDAVIGALDAIATFVDEARRKIADLDPEAKLDTEATA